MKIVLLNILSKVTSLALIGFGAWAYENIDHAIGGWCVFFGLLGFAFNNWTESKPDSDE